MPDDLQQEFHLTAVLRQLSVPAALATDFRDATVAIYAPSATIAIASTSATIPLATYTDGRRVS